MVALLAVTTVFFAIMTAVNRISLIALIKYMDDNGFPDPGEEELRRCVAWALRRAFRIRK